MAGFVAGGVVANDPVPATFERSDDAGAAVGALVVLAGAVGTPALPGAGLFMAALGPPLGLPGGSRSGPTQLVSVFAATPRQTSRTARPKCLSMVSRTLLTDPSVYGFSAVSNALWMAPCSASGRSRPFRLTADTYAP